MPVALHRLDLRGLLSSFWYSMQDSAVEWSLPLIAIAVFLLRPRNPAARLLFLASAAFGVVAKLGWAAATVSHNFAPAPVFYLYELTSSFWGYLLFPAFVLLALSFPLRIFPLTRWPRAVPLLLFGAPLVLTLAAIAAASEVLVAVTLGSQALLLLLAVVAALLNAGRVSRDPVARAQALWVLFGFALSIVPVPFVYVIGFYWHVAPNLPPALSTLTILALPVCLAIAITRYRLFDIHVIIRKTLQYALLTALLALVYFGAVVVLQSLLRFVTGNQPDVAIILSTLAIAALFNPLRHRVQEFIDRRFYRSKYHAEQILADFAASTRDEVELERLTRALLVAVEDSMQPAHASLWLRPAAGRQEPPAG